MSKWKSCPCAAAAEAPKAPAVEARIAATVMETREAPRCARRLVATDILNPLLSDARFAPLCTGHSGVETPPAAKSSCFGEKTTPELNSASGTSFAGGRRGVVNEHHIAIGTLVRPDREVCRDGAHEPVDIALVEDTTDPHASCAVVSDDDVSWAVAVHSLHDARKRLVVEDDLASFPRRDALDVDMAHPWRIARGHHELLAGIEIDAAHRITGSTGGKRFGARGGSGARPRGSGVGDPRNRRRAPGQHYDMPFEQSHQELRPEKVDIECRPGRNDLVAFRGHREGPRDVMGNVESRLPPNQSQ